AAATRRGGRIRTPPKPGSLATVGRVGGLGGSTAFGEVDTSPRSGVVGGVGRERRGFDEQKWYEVAKYVSLSNYVWSANCWFINKDKYESLSTTERAAPDKAEVDTPAWYRSQLAAVSSNTQQVMQGTRLKVHDRNPRPCRELRNPLSPQP
ncbi:C4-dicarboxylate ABC transporter, partial [Pseudomonas syringae]